MTMRKGEQRLQAISAMDRTIINNGRNYTQKEEQEVEAISHLLEEITVLLSQWNGLQMAVENQWGGRDSLQKAHQLAVDILSWFCQSKAPLYVDDLETLLHESLLLSLNTEIEDGSIEEVAEKLMIMYEEYLQRYHGIIDGGREEHH